MTTRGELHRFTEKVRLALESSRHGDPDGGTSGLEVELNVLDEDLRPVVTAGAGPESRSFADFLHDEVLPEWVRDRFQLEVFHWMTELTTRPHYSARSTAAEARLLEGVLVNALADLSLSQGCELRAVHGNIPRPVECGPASIPGGWNLARRRYLERCVALYGSQLATAGVHTNHSYPEALLSWDFLHLPVGKRRGRTLEDHRNDAVIRATRLLRPFCPVFIAVSAASPLAWTHIDGRDEAVLTDTDSQRLLAFPNPSGLDVPGLYADHASYLRLSYDLVRRGVRFGANNWTPVRARSGVEPVNRNILATADELRELYRRGIYAAGENGGLEEAERRLIVEKLCARVDLPMSRVEVRTDEAGDPFELSVAKIVLKDLLMLRIYADPEFGAGYAYDATDITRARRNEMAAAQRGLDARMEHPFSGAGCRVREVLGELLDAVGEIAEGLDLAEELEPLREMAAGGSNPAGKMRAWIRQRLGGRVRTLLDGSVVVPAEVVCEWIDAKRDGLAREITEIARGELADEEGRRDLGPLLHHLEVMGRERPGLPVSVGETSSLPRVTGVSDPVADVIELAAALVRIPSVTNCPAERRDEVHRCARFLAGTLADAGLKVRLFDDGPYASLVAGFPEAGTARVCLSGHLDVVMPEPDDRQFEPRVEGDYLWGRGAADMKTVVASYVVWMRDIIRRGGPRPPVNLMLVGNEENGEKLPWGTPHLLAELAPWRPELMIVGERTGEGGSEELGSVCTANRGIVRLALRARGERGHTGTGAVPADLIDRFIEARGALASLFDRRLTLSSLDGWESTVRFPFVAVGDPGVYNITAGEGVLGVEVRPIPEDDIPTLISEIDALAREIGLECDVELGEAGIVCPPDNPCLASLLEAWAAVAGKAAEPGRKKPGSSARFAPGGNAVVWGQSGIGPHSSEERHFIPSIGPYLEVLDRLAERLRGDE